MNGNGPVAGGGITEDEAALYDRQIRLWGVEAQNKMRTSSVLLVTLRGLSAEIAKNIVLAGIGSLTLLDDQLVHEADLGADFFLREDDIGKFRVDAAVSRVQALNPRVKVDTAREMSKLHDATFLSQFDLIVCTEVDAPTLLRLNTLTRSLGKKLFAAASIGMDGWIFADLLDHDYVADQVKTIAGVTTSTPTKYTISYCDFATALQQKWEGVKGRPMRRISTTLWAILALFAYQKENPIIPPTAESLSATANSLLPTLFVDSALVTPALSSRISRTVGMEFPATTAILGGLVGQDILNTLGGKQEPLYNFMIFDGESGAGEPYLLQPQQ